MRGPRKSPPASARAAHLSSVSSAFLEIPFFFSLPFLFIWVRRKKRPSLNSKIFRAVFRFRAQWCANSIRSEEHTSELQSLRHLVCRLLLEKKKKKKIN